MATLARVGFGAPTRSLRSDSDTSYWYSTTFPTRNMATTEAALMRVLAGEPNMIRFRPRKAEVADDRCLPMLS